MDNYWERLRSMKKNSTKKNRYKILYTWKSLEKLVPECGVEPHDHAKLGRLCDVPVIEKYKLQTKISKRVQFSNIWSNFL